MLHVKHLFSCLNYLIFVPFGIFWSIDANDNTPFSSPAKIIPCDNSPRNFTGFKFVTQITFYLLGLLANRILQFQKQLDAFLYLSLVEFSTTYLPFTGSADSTSATRNSTLKKSSIVISSAFGSSSFFLFYFRSRGFHLFFNVRHFHVHF